MKFALTWYVTNGEEYVGERELPKTTETDIRKAFGIADDEYAGYCKEISEDHLEWLRPLTPELHLKIDRYDYFIEPYSD